MAFALRWRSACRQTCVVLADSWEPPKSVGAERTGGCPETASGVRRSDDRPSQALRSLACMRRGVRPLMQSIVQREGPPIPLHGWAHLNSAAPGRVAVIAISATDQDQPIPACERCIGRLVSGGSIHDLQTSLSEGTRFETDGTAPAGHHRALRIHVRPDSQLRNLVLCPMPELGTRRFCQRQDGRGACP